MRQKNFVPGHLRTDCTGFLSKKNFKKKYFGRTAGRPPPHRPAAAAAQPAPRADPPAPDAARALRLVAACARRSAHSLHLRRVLPPADHSPPGPPLCTVGCQLSSAVGIFCHTQPDTWQVCHVALCHVAPATSPDMPRGCHVASFFAATGPKPSILRQ